MMLSLIRRASENSKRATPVKPASRVPPGQVYRATLIRTTYGEYVSHSEYIPSLSGSARVVRA